MKSWPRRNNDRTAMNAEPITIQVDPEAALAYRSVSDDERRKLDLLLSLRLREVTRPGASLEDVMDEISRNAQERGLTQEILKAILDER
jgi:hypothetical protein